MTLLMCVISTVTSCNRVAAALVKLRENVDAYNLVISDVYMPDDNGFTLLEVVALEMDLPVISNLSSLSLLCYYCHN